MGKLQGDSALTNVRLPIIIVAMKQDAVMLKGRIHGLIRDRLIK